jgi:hypothetical protein
MLSHKKAWVRKKERKQNKVQSNRTCLTPQPESRFRSKKTLYNVTSKARKVLPLNPEKYACVVKNLVQNTQKIDKMLTILWKSANKNRNVKSAQ